MKRLACIVGLGLACVVGCNTPQQQLRRHWVGRPAPDFELEGMDGQRVRLSAYRGRPVVLAFWAYN